MCRDAFFAQKICAECILQIPCLTQVTLVFSLLWFSRDLRKARSCLNPSVLSLMIVNWLLNPSARFEPTFSTQDTFQVQILTKIYDKTRVYRKVKAEFRVFLVNFVPFFEVLYWSGSRHRHDQETT